MLTTIWLQNRMLEFFCIVLARCVHEAQNMMILHSMESRCRKEKQLRPCISESSRNFFTNLYPSSTNLKVQCHLFKVWLTLFCKYFKDIFKFSGVNFKALKCVWVLRLDICQFVSIFQVGVTSADCNWRPHKNAFWVDLKFQQQGVAKVRQKAKCSLGKSPYTSERSLTLSQSCLRNLSIFPKSRKIVWATWTASDFR